MAIVFKPDKKRLAGLGYVSLAHVPVLFDSRQRYRREYNHYLRDRATLEWRPPNAMGDYPRDRTLLNIAYSLSNWVEWCEKKGISFKTATYEDVLRYQNDQEKGRWSASGKRLKAGTANTRADEVTLCLIWGAERGLRGPFDPKFVSVQLPFRNNGGGRTMAGHRVMRRAGRVKEARSDSVVAAFALPSPASVKYWLESVRHHRGRAKYLACRLILEAGPRKREVEALAAQQWPDRATIDDAFRRNGVFVPMNLVETKGGRPRTIKVPARFALEVREWIDTVRNTLVYRLYRREGRRTDKLFVSDAGGYEGIPIRAHTIYDCFHEVEPRPPAWSPHKGRHSFACFFVLHALEMEARARGAEIAGMGVDWVNARGEWWLKTLQRQFGHSSLETTEVYLRWLVSAAGLSQMASGWHEFLAAEENGETP